MYEGLVTFETGGVKIVPQLAEKWDKSDDGLTWTFHLHQGVKFFDGHELDANDVVATYEAAWNAKSPNHVGEKTHFTYWAGFFGPCLNGPDC
jgi:peptide/nickel transport system substrate-binding protein